jgi:hypothetical protein
MRSLNELPGLAVERIKAELGEVWDSLSEDYQREVADLAEQWGLVQVKALTEGYDPGMDHAVFKAALGLFAFAGASDARTALKKVGTSLLEEAKPFIEAGAKVALKAGIAFLISL